MKSKQMDETDERILRELKKNCRQSYRKLATGIGLSPAALIDRMKKLEKKGFIKGYSVNLDYEKLGFEFEAMVQISMSHGAALLEVQKKIAKLSGVSAVYDITGKYDSMAILKCKSRQELSALIKKILNLPKVEKTNTNMILNIVKENDEFLGV
jgi:Lrp/AsnC family transcriptional regulator for asnA, asnC and gidA